MMTAVDMQGRRIERTMVIDGVVTPAFIHNGGYFFVNVPVYADGLIECWEMVDLPLFDDKLRQGWVVTAVPDGEEISVHGLGAWTVADGAWALTPAGLHARVQALVKELNPDLVNLYDCRGRTSRSLGPGKMQVSILGMPEDVPIRFDDPKVLLPERIKGKSLSVLARHDGRLFLADLRLFADGKVELGRMPGPPRLLSVAELAAAARKGDVLSKPAVGERVEIVDLGAFTVAAEQWTADIDEVMKEVRDGIETLNGRSDSIARCRVAFDAYMARPSDEGRQALREAYEAVPEHKRMYVGDMDTKDIPVRMIVYGDKEIENWTHRAVARTHGLEPLPTITVPRPPAASSSSSSSSSQLPRDRAALLAAMSGPAALRHRYLLFWGHTPSATGAVGKECLSQWWPAPFVVDGRRYPTAEHFMMAEKARLFGDEASRARILAAASPAAAKKLGRGVRGFDEAAWKAARFDIVVAGSVAKFGQNAALGAFLDSTGDDVLVEASPKDRIWGIGLGAGNQAATDPARWRGLNLLGFALMEARRRLRVSASAGSPS